MTSLFMNTTLGVILTDDGDVVMGALMAMLFSASIAFALLTYSVHNKGDLVAPFLSLYASIVMLGSIYFSQAIPNLETLFIILFIFTLAVTTLSNLFMLFYIIAICSRRDNERPPHR